MLLIAVYWIFLFLLFLPAGILVKQALKLSTNNPVLLVLLGMVLLTSGFTIVSFFTGLGTVNLIVWSVLSLASGIIFRTALTTVITTSISKFRILPGYLKIATTLLCAGALLKSAQFPFVIDNESYYVQTIKWFNEYGMVKGMANLHVYFAQNSLWHVLQAGVNFSFITNRINDINGFLFVICTIYYLTESHKINAESNKRYWLGFMLIFSILLFQFIQAPSPDLPCLLLVPIIFHLYLKSSGQDTDIKIAFILFMFLVVIKITIIPIGIVFLPSLRYKKIFQFMFFTAMPLGLLWIVKNIITSGYPLYPLASFKTGFDWALPTDVYRFMIDVNANDGYYDKVTAPAVNTLIVKLSSWIRLGGMAGLINKLTILLLLVMPLTPQIIKDKKHRFIYLSLLVNFLALLLTSPQFRYFLHVTICVCLFVGVQLYNYFKSSPVVYKSVLLASAVSVFLLLFNTPLTAVTNNKHHQNTGVFATRQLYQPEVNTKFPDLVFEKLAEGNLNYYSPTENFFFYGTADGPLPCINTMHLHYFKRKFGVVPQLRGNTLKDGFYSQSVK